MAEFAASILGLTSTAEVVFTRIFKYIKHVKHAEQEVLELSAEVSGFYGVLKSVSLVVDGFVGVGDGAITNATQITACSISLDRSREKLAQFHEVQDQSSRDVQRKWK